jgi:hypothetical protein
MLNSDLALEAKEMYEEDAGEVTEIEGVKATVTKDGDITVTKVEILNEKGEKALGKAKGTYHPRYRPRGPAGDWRTCRSRPSSPDPVPQPR